MTITPMEASDAPATHTLSVQALAAEIEASVDASAEADTLIEFPPNELKPVKIHPTAMVEDNVTLGPGTSVWDNAHIRHDATLGEDCIVGGKSYIAYGVSIGNRVKINAFAYICNAVTIEDGVMISAGTIFTNDRFPRAATPDLKSLYSSAPDEHTLPTLVKQGATIGAHCTIGNDLDIGRFAMVGMGSVVTKSIPDFHLAYGVPARSVGAVCRCGEPLMRFPEEEQFEEAVSCDRCGLTYHIKDRVVSEWTPPN